MKKNTSSVSTVSTKGGKPLTKRDLVRDGKQDKRLAILCRQLQDLVGDEVKSRLEQGRLIYGEVYQFIKEERERNKDPRPQFEIRPTEYGSQRINKIAIALNRDAKTIRNRVYFFLMVDFVGGYDENLSPNHYISLYGFRKNIGFTTPVDDVVQGQTGKDTVQFVKNIYAEAAKKKWTADHLFEKLKDKYGAPVSNTVKPHDNELEKLSKSFFQSAKDAVNYGNRLFEQAPDPTKLVFDTTEEIFIQLLQMFHKLRNMTTKEGLEFLDDKLVQDFKVNPLKKMSHAVYVGSKRRQLEGILVNIAHYVDWDSIKTACDVFAGRSHVAHALKQQDWAVTANDKLRWAYLWAKWVVESDKIALTDRDLDALLKPAKNKNPKYNFIIEKFFKEHGGKVPKIFEENAIIAQNYLSNLSKLMSDKRDLALCLLSVTINDLMPFSQESHGKPSSLQYKLEEELWSRLKEANEHVFKGKRKCRATNLDAIEFLKKYKFDLAYFDPPYLVGRPLYKSQLPESIAKEKYVEKDFFESSFIENKMSALKAFDEMFAAADKSARYWVVSYNSTSKINQWELGEIISKYRTQVNFAISHRMTIGQLETQQNKQMTNEILIVCAPYPIGMEHKNIVSTVRHNKEHYDDGVWLDPGTFVEKDEVDESDEILVDVEVDGEGRISFRIASDLGPECHKYATAVGVQLNCGK